MVLFVSEKLKAKKHQPIDHQELVEHLLFVTKSIIYKKLANRKELLSNLNFIHGVDILSAIPKISRTYFKLEFMSL